MNTTWQWRAALLLMGSGLGAFIAPLLPVAAQSSVVAVGVPGRENAFVTAAVEGAVVALAWAASVPDGATDIYAALSRDAGLSFGAPVRVNSVPGMARVNGEQPPRVVLVPRRGALPDLVVVWTAREAAGTRLLSARSTDGAKTFGPASVVPGTAAAGNRGWESAAVDDRGRTLVLWLDHRETASAGGGHVHGAGNGSAARAADGGAARAADGGADGVARAQLSKLYIGAADGSLPARPLAGGVCYCCKTALVTSAGGLHSAWRHVYTGNRRDIAYAASHDGGRTFSPPVRVSADDWQIDGCPENGPALAAQGRRVHIVWPTMVRDEGTERLTLFHAVTDDGRTFSARERLPAAGFAHHPQVTVDSQGNPAVVWEETSPQGRRIKLWRGAAADDLGPGTHPAIVSTPTHAIVAWTGRGVPLEQIAVRRIGHLPSTRHQKQP